MGWTLFRVCRASFLAVLKQQAAVASTQTKLMLPCPDKQLLPQPVVIFFYVSPVFKLVFLVWIWGTHKIWNSNPSLGFQQDSKFSSHLFSWLECNLFRKQYLHSFSPFYWFLISLKIAMSFQRPKNSHLVSSRKQSLLINTEVLNQRTKKSLIQS